MRRINKRIQNENILRLIILILGAILLLFSIDFGWGFILGGIISKENINLNDKTSWQLLILITTVMSLVIYILLDISAIYGYLLSTFLYFIIRISLEKYQKK